MKFLILMSYFQTDIRCIFSRQAQTKIASHASFVEIWSKNNCSKKQSDFLPCVILAYDFVWSVNFCFTFELLMLRFFNSRAKHVKIEMPQLRNFLRLDKSHLTNHSNCSLVWVVFRFWATIKEISQGNCISIVMFCLCTVIS